MFNRNADGVNVLWAAQKLPPWEGIIDTPVGIWSWVAGGASQTQFVHVGLQELLSVSSYNKYLINAVPDIKKREHEAKRNNSNAISAKVKAAISAKLYTTGKFQK